MLEVPNIIENDGEKPLKSPEVDKELEPVPEIKLEKRKEVQEKKKKKNLL